MLNFVFVVLQMYYNEDRLKLLDDIIGSRKVLVASKLLKKPAQEGVGFFKSTLRRYNYKYLSSLLSSLI